MQDLKNAVVYNGH